MSLQETVLLENNTFLCKVGWRQACFSHSVSATFYILSSLFLNKAASLYCLRLSPEMHLDRFSQSCEHHIMCFQSHEAIDCTKPTSMQRKVFQNSKLIQIPLLKIPPENRVSVRSQKGHQAQQWLLWSHWVSLPSPCSTALSLLLSCVNGSFVICKLIMSLVQFQLQNKPLLVMISEAQF